jgi:hypothetical protein
MYIIIIIMSGKISQPAYTCNTAAGFEQAFICVHVYKQKPKAKLQLDGKADEISILKLPHVPSYSIYYILLEQHRMRGCGVVDI